MEVEELAPGLWRWTAPHPAWRPGHGWGRDVACFYAETDEATVLIDPLLPEEGERDRFLAYLDGDVARRGLPVAIVLTGTSHVRSTGELAERYDAGVWADEAVRDTVGRVEFHSIAPRQELIAGLRVLPVAFPSGVTPIYLSQQRALAPGDLLVSVDGELRVWWVAESEEDERFYEEQHLPELRGWLDLDVEHVLVAHGEQPRGAAGEELVAALTRPPWDVG